MKVGLIDALIEELKKGGNNGNDKDKCVYGEGYDLTFDVNYCTAEGFAKGVKVTLTKLKYMPWDKAI